MDEPQADAPVDRNWRGAGWPLLIAVVLGLGLGPVGLGQFAPGTYRSWFVGGQIAQQQSKALEQQTRQTLDELARGEGNPATALIEIQSAQRRQAELALAVERARSAREQDHRSMMVAIILTALLLMIFEATSPAEAWRLRGRLARARMGLIALWVVLLLIRPDVLQTEIWFMVAALAAVTLVSLAVPIREETSIDVG
ncbi:MAG: hypothetical protein R3336_00955 [Phycisphaeraceae bacterium]|nr:hypothetical protein [Phycisphaeraceae bacterium]